MRHLTVRLIVAALTFFVGVGAASVWLYRRSHRPVAALNDRSTARTPGPQAEPPAGDNEEPKDESPEAKAVRTAEEFIARNGYTDLPPERDRLSHETVERASSVDELLAWRHNTLERKAYGVAHRGRLGTRGGWTVVFRPCPRYGGEVDTWGRAVTMDKDFKNLLVEHKPYPLANVDKKL